MRPSISHSNGWQCMIAATLLLSLGQAAVIGVEESPGLSNVPPPGFTALFNGQDFTGWRLSPKAKAMWSIEEGVLKAPALLEEWGADLETEKKYQDFVLQADFRMPAKSDSGIFFRSLIPDMGNFGQSEQFKIRSDNGMGLLLSFELMPENVKKSLGLEAQDLPQIKPVHPAIKVWHTVKLTVIGTRLMAELDGDRILDYQYPKGYLATEPAPIRFQKHRFVEGANPAERNPCPIEYRNIFIKDLGPSDATASAPPPSKREDRSEGEQNSRPTDSPNAALLARIDAGDLPEGYEPAKHQQYVDRRMAELTEDQRGTVGRLWKEKEKTHPAMPNRGYSFVKIMMYVANGE